MLGVNVPLQACEHFYIVSEPIAGLTQLPVLRVPDECAYYKEDAGKILLGAFEPVAKPWGMNGISEDFEFDQLPEGLLTDLRKSVVNANAPNRSRTSTARRSSSARDACGDALPREASACCGRWVSRSGGGA